PEEPEPDASFPPCLRCEGPTALRPLTPRLKVQVPQRYAIRSHREASGPLHSGRQSRVLRPVARQLLRPFWRPQQSTALAMTSVVSALAWRLRRLRSPALAVP